MARGSGVPESTIQTALFQMEMGRGKRVIQWALLVLLAAALSLIYSASQFRGLNKRESMDMAQLARNMARGEGYTTYVIRPLSIWMLEQHGWSKTDPRLTSRHPDLYNPPLYPFVLAGLFKMLPASSFTYDAAERVFPPERWVILPFNQLCLLACVLIVFLWAKRLFDRRVAILAAVVMLFSDTLWSYGVSGLPTNFLMLLLLLAVYFLFLVDQRLNPPEPAEGEETSARAPTGVTAGIIALILGSAVLMGLCFLTRYLSAFLLIPMVIYAARILRGRGAALWAGVYVVVFFAVILPWLVRNYQVSGSLLGIARYDLVDRSTAFQGEALQRSYHPELKDTLSLRSISTKFLIGARANLLTNLRFIGADFLVFFFGVGLMYSFRRRDTSRLRGTLLGLLVGAIIGMSLIGSDPERMGPEVFGGNLLVLLLPLVAIFGAAFFYLLLDRVSFRVKLTRGAAIGGFILLNVAAIIFTFLPPRRNLYAYPPYIPPVPRAVADYFEADALGCSDLPWEMAWNGDRRTVWLPMTQDEFYEINDFVAPKGFQFAFLTPYMLDQKPQSEVNKGEYKGWAGLMRGQLPQIFPLKAITPLPFDNEQILLADRARWAKKEGDIITAVPGVTNTPAPATPSTDKTNQPPSAETAPKPASQ